MCNSCSRHCILNMKEVHKAVQIRVSTRLATSQKIKPWCALAAPEIPLRTCQTEQVTRADPHGSKRTQRGLSKISRQDAPNHPALGYWEDFDELWVTSECVHVRSSSVSSVRSVSDRTKNLITWSNSVIRVLTRPSGKGHNRTRKTKLRMKPSV